MIIDDVNSCSSVELWYEAVEEPVLPIYSDVLLFDEINELLKLGWNAKKINSLNYLKVFKLKRDILTLAKIGWQPEQINLLSDEVLSSLILWDITKIAAYGWTAEQVNQLNLSIAEDLWVGFLSLLKLKWTAEDINRLDSNRVKILKNNIVDLVEEGWSIADINSIDIIILNSLSTLQFLQLAKIWKKEKINQLDNLVVKEIKDEVIQFAQKNWTPQKINQLNPFALKKLNFIEIDQMLEADMGVDQFNLLSKHITCREDKEQTIELIIQNYPIELTRAVLFIQYEMAKQVGGYGFIAALMHLAWQKNEIFRVSPALKILNTKSIIDLAQKGWKAEEINALKGVPPVLVQACGGYPELVFLVKITGWRADEVSKLKPKTVEMFGVDKVANLAATENFTPSAVNRLAFFDYHYIQSKFMQVLQKILTWTLFIFTYCCRPSNDEKEEKTPVYNPQRKFSESNAPTCVARQRVGV